MKRDSELIRSMLFEFESSEDFILDDSLTDGSTAEERARFYHIQLMKDSGFVVSLGKYTSRMTSQGHDFLEAVRDEGIWEETKAGVNKIGGATLSVLASIAVAYGKQAIEDKLGLKL